MYNLCRSSYRNIRCNVVTVCSLMSYKLYNPTADIYISMVSATNQVSTKGWYVAMVSTTVETANPEAEILPGLQLLGPITEKCVLLNVLLKEK